MHPDFPLVSEVPTGYVLRMHRSSDRAWIFVSLLAFGALFVASRSHAAPEALVDTASLWDSGRIEVCFATSETRVNPKADIAKDVGRIPHVVDHGPFEADVRGVLEREFAAERTGMTFVGYGNCDRVPRDEPSAPAFIFADTDAKDFGLTSIGDESKLLEPADRRGLISGTILNLRLVKANKDYSVARAAKALLKIAGSGTPTANRIVDEAADLDEELVQQLRDVVVLHEMGHLAGLLHEERRKDATGRQPPWCRSADDRREQEPGTEKTYGTEFDPFSVMNYCTDDIAKGFAFYHLLCAFPEISAGLSRANPKFDWEAMRPYCDFMMSRSYAARLSLRDRAALRRAYLGVAIPAGSRTYRTNPEEVRVLDALDALYEALPDSMELDPKPSEATNRPRW